MDRDRIEELVEELIDERSLEALERLTGSNHERVISALIEVAGTIIEDDRAEESDDTIVEEIQAHVVKAAQIGPLVDALENNKNPNVREFALACLGEIGDLTATEPMIDRLEDEEPGVREAALEHLTLLTDQDFGPDPAPWRKWLETVAEREKLRVQEQREELAEKKQKRSKVNADVAADEDSDEASDDGDSRRVRRARDDDDDSEVASVDRDLEDDF